MRLLKLVPDNTNIDFVRLRGWAFGLTLALTLLAVGVTFAKGLNLGVDFVGGLMIEEKFPTPPSADRVRSVIDGLGVGEANIQTVGDGRTISIRLPAPKSNDDGATNAVVRKVETALGQQFPGATFSRYDTVSGKVRASLSSTACWRSCWRCWVSACSRSSASNGSSACRPSSRSSTICW